jgi:2C-methyl-D-erythritol 2,4-cyclodiphosphate synthase
MEVEWRQRLGKVRANSATDVLLRALIGAPVLTVNSAAGLIGRSFPQTNAAIERLVDEGILSQVTVGRRNRAFEAGDVIRAFTELERQLATPDDDSDNSRPIRPVPRQ